MMRDRLTEQSDCGRSLTRAWNIALRTTHICVTGVLIGGHVFGVGAAQLTPWLYIAVITGLVLMAVEAYPSWRYFCEGRGVMVLAKVAVLCMIPWFWSARVFMLAVVVILASIGSHMPRRFRHYSLVEGRVIEK
jgi:hypothetical protein